MKQYEPTPPNTENGQSVNMNFSWSEDFNKLTWFFEEE